jgi:hypothetical protein
MIWAGPSALNPIAIMTGARAPGYDENAPLVLKGLA